MRERWSPISISHLRYFLAAVETGSFRGASRHLSVETSSVSRRMRDLESHVGTLLFWRERSGVALTPAGEDFLHHAREAMRHLHGSIQKTSGARSRSHAAQIRIGFPDTFSARPVSKLLHTFSRSYSNVGVVSVAGDALHHMRAIRNGQLDLAFAARKCVWPELKSMSVWKETLFLALPQQHPLARNDFIHAWDLTKDTLIVNDQSVALVNLYFSGLNEITEANGCDLKIVHHPVDRETILAMVELGSGVALISDEDVSSRAAGVVVRPISGKTLELSAVWLHENGNPFLPALLEIVGSMTNSAILRELTF